jgi:hypothetical protein
MKAPRERKAPKGLYYGSIQLTNWSAKVFASTMPELGRRVVAVVVTYPNDQCEVLNLTVGEFRSLAWIENLHIDAITYVTDESERRRIVEAIQTQGVPELMDADEFDNAWEQTAEELCEKQRLRVEIC